MTTHGNTSVLWSLRATACACALVLASGPAFAQSVYDFQFEWPVGVTGADGVVRYGHDFTVMQNFFNTDGPFPGQEHAGMDLTRRDGAANADDAPVYAAADGEVACSNRANTYDVRQDYPGKVVVIRHPLPGGGSVYTQYAHLNFCQRDPSHNCANQEAYCDPNWDNPTNPAPCVQPGDIVRRGQAIGSITRWREDGVFYPDNTHLHFEVRTFLYWDYASDEPTGDAPQEGRQIACAGRGYRASGNAELDPGYLDPVEYILSRRPPYPTPALLHGEERRLRDAPSTDAAEVVLLPAGAALTSEGLVRDASYDCAGSDCRRDCNGADDCRECNWWQRVRYNDGGTPRVGYLNAFALGGYRSEIAVGEPLRLAGRWIEPLERALIHYTFAYDDAAADRLLTNQITGVGLRGEVRGALIPVSPRPPLPEDFMGFDGASTYVEAQGSARLDFSQGLRVKASLRRDANADTDVLFGQWDPADPARQSWMVRFVAPGPTPDLQTHPLPSTAGVLEVWARFVGESAPTVLRYPLPDCEYLEGFNTLALRYDPAFGLRLYWNERRVAGRDLTARRDLQAPQVPLRIGSLSDAPGDAERLAGLFDAFRLWADVQPDAAVESVLVIDSSGSMTSNDPQSRRKEAARAFLTINPPGDSIGVVDFDSIARVFAPLTRVPAGLGTLRQAIDRIDSSGGTNIGAGVGTGHGVLTQGVGPTRAAILLTDGVGSYSNQHQLFVASGWKIFTLGFGQADKSLLCLIASATGGDYNMGEDCSSLAPPAPLVDPPGCAGSEDCAPEAAAAAALAGLTPETMVCAFQHMRSKVEGGAGVECRTQAMAAGETYAFDYPLGRGQRYFTLTASGSSLAGVTMTLTTPDGRLIDAATQAVDVAYGKGLTYEVFRLSRPEGGLWRVSLRSPVAQNVVIGIAGIPVQNEPPDVSLAVAAPGSLWPPNHQFVPIAIEGVSDPDGDPVTLTVTGITQDEAVQAPGTGNTSPDGAGVGTAAAQVRAERKGGGNGRVYRIAFTASDEHGGQAEGHVSVCVPKSEGHTTCTDDGQVHDSTQP